jgi:hypothetical protein
MAGHQVNTDISDIFFNMDHEEAALFDASGNFASYSEEVLTYEADDLLEALRRLGSQAAYHENPGDLVVDFLGRV